MASSDFVAGAGPRTPLSYGKDASARVAGIYRTAEIERQRAVCVELLASRPGERVLDIGCGPGLLAVDLARSVGRHGRVLAADVSVDMLSIAARSAEAAGVSAVIAPLRLDATAIPLAGGVMDAVVAVQTLEWVPRVDDALAESFRVIRPGGRILVLDTDWSAIQWHSDDPQRLDRLVAAWAGATAWAALPRSLPDRLRAAGFADVEVATLPIEADRLDPDGYAARQIDHMAAVVRERGALRDDELAAIHAEQRTLSRTGRFHFRVLRTIVTARRPGSAAR